MKHVIMIEHISSQGDLDAEVEGVLWVAETTHKSGIAAVAFRESPIGAPTKRDALRMHHRDLRVKLWDQMEMLDYTLRRLETSIQLHIQLGVQIETDLARMAQETVRDTLARLMHETRGSW
jgi:hypothetical protein